MIDIINNLNIDTAYLNVSNEITIQDNDCTLYNIVGNKLYKVSNYKHEFITTIPEGLMESIYNNLDLPF